MRPKLRRQTIGFVTVMFGAYLALVSQNETPQPVSGNGSVVPSLFALNAHASVYDSESGALSWSMYSPRINYFEASNLVIADTPSLILYKDSHTSPWHVDAGRAAIYKNEQLVRLNQDVVMKHAGNNGITQIIETARIDYYPRRNFAEAIYPIEINQGKNNTKADQLQLWMEREYMELKGNVESNYEIN